ncbi:MAG TPA: hypothetical protein VI387_10880 [Candidatus Brocadiales bacterium]|nr:hypothetical protein [Candidatus Brocadiales bacterium]
MNRKKPAIRAVFTNFYPYAAKTSRTSSFIGCIILIYIDSGIFITTAKLYTEEFLRLFYLELFFCHRLGAKPSASGGLGTGVSEPLPQIA